MGKVTERFLIGRFNKLEGLTNERRVANLWWVFYTYKKNIFVV